MSEPKKPSGQGPQRKPPARFQPPRAVLMLLLAFGLIYLMAMLLKGPMTEAEKKTRSDFHQDMQAGRVKSVDISPRQAKIELYPDESGAVRRYTFPLMGEEDAAMLGQLQTSAGYLVSEPEVWREFCEAHFAVLDDIGCQQRVTDHPYHCLKTALDVREGGSLVCASNLTLAQIDKLFDDRITSRLSAGTVVHVTGDQRQMQGRDVR